MEDLQGIQGSVRPLSRSGVWGWTCFDARGMLSLWIRRATGSNTGKQATPSSNPGTCAFHNIESERRMCPAHFLREFHSPCFLQRHLNRAPRRKCLGEARFPFHPKEVALSFTHRSPGWAKGYRKMNNSKDAGREASRQAGGGLCVSTKNA